MSIMRGLVDGGVDRRRIEGWVRIERVKLQYFPATVLEVWRRMVMDLTIVQVDDKRAPVDIREVYNIHTVPSSHFVPVYATCESKN